MSFILRNCTLASDLFCFTHKYHDSNDPKYGEKIFYLYMLRIIEKEQRATSPFLKQIENVLPHDYTEYNFPLFIGTKRQNT